MLPREMIIGLIWCTLALVRLTAGFQCSTCVRDGTCETIRGIFSITVMSQGYNPVVTIPRGACNVNVTEAAASNNVLALKDSDYTYVFNGHWKTDEPGRYDASGTQFVYVRDQQGCPGECIYAEGPLLQNVTVQLLYHDRSPGIFYTYQVPIDNSDQQGSHPFPAAAELRQRPSEVREEETINTHARTVRPEVTTPPASFPEESPLPEASYIRRKGPIFSSDFSHMRQRQGKRHREDTIGHRQRPSSLGERRALTGVTYSRGIDDNVVNIRDKKPKIGDDEGFDLNNELTSDDLDVSSSGDEKEGLDIFDYIIKSDDNDNPTVNDLEPFSWRVAGLTECSRICGEGVQHTKYDCVQTSTNQTVDESDCDLVPRPEVKHSVCNEQPCTPSWNTGSWSLCSTTCGSGYQTRNVTCQQRISATSNLEMEESHCDSEIPSDKKPCFSNECFNWKIGEWGQCSVYCGSGTKMRSVTCQDETGSVVSDENCTGKKARAEASCEGDACVRKWYFTNWTDQCSVDCGEGFVSRSVRCLSNNGRALTDALCDAADKPLNNKRCQQGDICGGKWFTGPWSKCSQSCGDGMRTRHVLCMKTLGGNLVMTPEHNCPADDKPATTDPCNEVSCGHRWFMTDWSECSKTCGGGVQTRASQCYDDNLRPVNRCPAEERPETSRPCNTDRCRETTQKKPVKKNGCADKYPNCRIVVQARLCRYHYYQRKCCDSCSNNVYTNVSFRG